MSAGRRGLSKEAMQEIQRKSQTALKKRREEKQSSAVSEHAIVLSRDELDSIKADPVRNCVPVVVREVTSYLPTAKKRARTEWTQIQTRLFGKQTRGKVPLTTFAEMEHVSTDTVHRENALLSQSYLNIDKAIRNSTFRSSARARSDTQRILDNGGFCQYDENPFKIRVPSQARCPVLSTQLQFCSKLRPMAEHQEREKCLSYWKGGGLFWKSRTRRTPTSLS